MKFNWGTGITIFLILFLGASAVFIIFAMRQDVNLVHEDYYERGVDHSEQMDVEVRSAAFKEDLLTNVDAEKLLIGVRGELAEAMDSASYRLYRPSDAMLDRGGDFTPGELALALPRSGLQSGRYILIFTWYSMELRHELQRTIVIP